jgi:hypothetical protein
MRFKGCMSTAVMGRVGDQCASNSQTFAAFGAACIDHGTATAGFHAHQKSMGAGAACFGGLVSAFHVIPFRYPDPSRKPMIIPKKPAACEPFKEISASSRPLTFCLCWPVDKFLITLFFGWIIADLSTDFYDKL